MDRLLIGRFFGPDMVALYRQPYQLVAAPVSQFMGPLYQVTMPSLSMLQNEPDRYRRFYHRVVTLVGLASIPLSVYLAVYANEITHLILGDKWSGAAVFMRIFAIGGIIRAINSITGFVMVSRGRSGLLLKLSTLNSGVMIGLMSLGTIWGPQGVAVAEVATLPIMLGPWMWYSFKESPVTVSSFLSALMRPCVCGLAVAVSLVVLRAVCPVSSVWLSLTLGATVAALAAVVSWLGLPGGRSELAAMFGDVLSALRRKRQAESVG
jgi:PST family polysaccharide transporter